MPAPLQTMTSGLLIPPAFFVLRTPFLPIDDFEKFGASLEACRLVDDAASPDEEEGAWRRDIAVLRERLGLWLESPAIRQALLIASPSLDASISHWKHDPDSKKGRQTERAIIRYFLRMTGRATPFGLFAGCSVGRIVPTIDEGDAHFCRLQPRSTYKLTSRLDYSYLSRVVDALVQLPDVARSVRYFPSPALQRVGDLYHYIERGRTDTGRVSSAVYLEHDEALQAVLTRARDGATLQDLIDAVCAVGDVGDADIGEQAFAYVQDLVRSQILLHDLSPIVTGPNALDDLVDRLSAIPCPTHFAASALAEARRDLEQLDVKGLGRSRGEYEAIAARLQMLPAAVDFERLFQVDLMKPLDSARLGRGVIDEVHRGLEFLRSAGAISMREPESVRAFREAFAERYGIAWVPLIEAIDEEAGIGFSRSGSDHGDHGDGNADGDVVGPTARRNKTSDAFQSTLLRKADECSRRGEQELLLDPSDFSVSEEHARFPHAFSVMVTVSARSADAFRQGDFSVYLRSAAGPSGATLLGRFCYADLELQQLVRAHLADEEENDTEARRSGAVYAEIVHLPAGRSGNVVARPVLRRYEIECFGRSGCAPERRLPLSDLMVTVRGKQVVLYSNRLKRRVIPRLTSAHGFNSDLCPPAYQLLGCLQHEPGIRLPSFDWGPLWHLPFLPRVRMGRIVFLEARWRISAKERDELTRGAPHECFFAVQRFRKSRRLPRWVQLFQAGSVLTADLDNPLAVDALIHVLKRDREGMLMEMYPAPSESSCVTGPEGRYHHELIIPFVVKAPLADDVPRSFPQDAPLPRRGIVRTYPPGSEWLYVKLYGGAASLERALINTVAPIIRQSTDSGLATSWFFLRYSDPQRHLRIRFRGEPRALTHELLPRLQAAVHPLIESGVLWKLETDTYIREIERYGGPAGIVEAESVFHADSEAVLEALSLSQEADARQRFGIAWSGLHTLFVDCGLELRERKEVARLGRDRLLRVVGDSESQRRHRDDQYRAERGHLAALLESGSEARSLEPFQGASREFERRSARIRVAAVEFRRLQACGELTRGFSDITWSFAHMHVNRALRTDTRVHELSLYDFLERFYTGQLARQRTRDPIPRG
jgi:thiopeptide-type bacteriocin biosynthesis protein